MSDELYVYVEGTNCPLDKALQIMSDDWIDAGQYCDETVLDLRDVIVSLRAEIERLRARLAEADALTQALKRALEEGRDIVSELSSMLCGSDWLEVSDAEGLREDAGQVQEGWAGQCCCQDEGCQDLECEASGQSGDAQT